MHGETAPRRENDYSHYKTNYCAQDEHGFKMCTGRQRLVGSVGEDGVAGHELVVHQARDDAALRRQAGQIIRKYWPRTGQIRVKC